MAEDWRPTASIETLKLRAGLLTRARRFFAERNVLEVETPVLSAAASVDPAIHSLTTRPKAGQAARYLHTSPEFPMKRLLCAGSGDIWQSCRVFRDGELGARHNPEFTLVEWYRCGWSLDRLMDETVDFVTALLKDHRALAPPRRLTYRDAFQLHLDVDPATAAYDDLVHALSAGGVPLPAGEKLTRDGLLDLAMGTLVAPALGGSNVPVLIHDYPHGQAALARIKPGNPPVAARFELFVDGIELANGFDELADPAEQAARFAAERAARRASGAAVVPADGRLLAALAEGLPDCSGVAVGFDRLVMLAAGVEHIGKVLAFSFERA